MALNIAMVMAVLVLYLSVGAAIIQAIDNHVRKDLEAIGQELPPLKPLPLASLLVVWPVPVAIYGVCVLFATLTER